MDVEREILTMLMDDHESPWILHEQLGRSPQIESVLEILDRFERSGWVEPWLSEEDGPILDHRAEALDEYRVHAVSRSRAPFQEYGPWYRITEAGRSEFERREAG